MLDTTFITLSARYCRQSAATRALVSTLCHLYAAQRQALWQHDADSLAAVGRMVTITLAALRALKAEGNHE